MLFPWPVALLPLVFRRCTVCRVLLLKRVDWCDPFLSCVPVSCFDDFRLFLAFSLFCAPVVSPVPVVSSSSRARWRGRRSARRTHSSREPGFPSTTACWTSASAGGAFPSGGLCVLCHWDSRCVCDLVLVLFLGAFLCPCLELL